MTEYISRNIDSELTAWKEDSMRKPLLLRGARQVGKSSAVKNFGKQFRYFAEINFERNKAIKTFFQGDIDVRLIAKKISSYINVPIEAGKTLLFLDEIQECPEAIMALRFFKEDYPELHVIAAGSLLEFTLQELPTFGVGRIHSLFMYPMTFDEFLLAMGEQPLINVLHTKDFSLIDSLSLRLTDYLRQYYYVGGMPAAVLEFVESKNLEEVRNIQKQILFDYQRDFSKHAPSQEVPRINMVWDSIPSQLAKENKKFIFGALKKGARASEFELAIQWLIDAGLVYQINRVSAPEMPLKFYAEMSVFKLFVLDVGLMGAMVDTPAESILVADTLLKEYKGAFTELFVLTQLMALQIPIYYFSSNDSRVEIDLIVQHGTTITPIEIKAEENVHAKSLRTFIGKHPNLKGLRLSMKPYQDQEWMVNKPLYAVGAWL